jgi:hypothetical protein
MVYGTVPAGPGFIGGLISSGAGKNTASDIPAVHMLVFLKNTATGILSQTYTDATGAYSFSSIAYGSYVIYPEVMGYATTVSATITLSASHASQTAVNFKQYTGSKTVKPIVNGIATLPTAAAFSVYPNPTAGSLNVKWNEQATGKADITVTDITGREIYQSVIDIAATSGNTSINLPVLSNGVYFVKIKSETINFTEKLTVQH